MAKRFITLVLVLLIGVPLLAFFGTALILFLAPGTEIFGVRYVAPGLSKFETQTNIESFSGDVYIETHGVPITIEVSSYYNSSVSFKQDFIGFTRSEYDKAGLDVEIENGDLHIKTKELVKFIYAQESESFYDFHLTLSSAYMSNKSVYVDSDKSSVKLIGSFNLNDFSLVTDGDLTIENQLMATNFKYHTDEAVVVDEKINCVNADLKSKGSVINVKKELSGDLTAETMSGDIRFISCKNLNVVTGSGTIKKYGEGSNEVRGATSITTAGGSVQLGALKNQSAKCEITTKSGNINISSMFDGELTSERGKIFVGSSRNLVINNNVGNVEVQSVSNQIVVNSRNGNVKLGANGIITNPMVETVTGVIEASNTSGKVVLRSEHNKVSITNAASSDITLYAGKALIAKGLKGNVSAYANANSELQFSEVNGNINIELGNKSDSVLIDATCKHYDDVDYSLKSTKGSKAKVYAGDELIDENTSVDSGTVAGHYKITVQSSYAEIILKLAV